MNAISRCGLSHLALAASSCSLLIAAPAMAQENDDNPAPTAADPANTIIPAVDPEIVVTAQRRRERLQDVPISISVLDGTALDRSRAVGLTEVLSRVPGVVTQKAQGANTILSVRGVGSAFNIYRGTSTTALYVDSVPFGFVKSGFLPDLSLYDMDRVEVLRGPQGSLYGASALNGVVRVVTSEANTKTFDVKGRGTLSHTQSGGTNGRADVAVNVPLIRDRLAVRATAGYEKYSGWIDTPANKDVNDLERKTLRIKVSALPTDDLSLGLSYWRSKDHRNGSDGGTSQSYDASSVDQPSGGGFSAYGAKVGYEFRNLTLNSQTSLIDYAHYEISDPLVGAQARAAAGLPYDNQALLTRTKSNVFAQDVSLSSRAGAAWRWSAGAFYRTAKDNLYQRLPAALPNPVDFDDRSKSYAVFGEVTRSLADGRVEITGGLRYFHDRVEQIEASRFGADPTKPLIHYEVAFKRLTPRAVVTWRPAQDTSLYASYGEGFRSGYGQNIIALYSSPELPPIKPDKLRNFEIGAKGRMFDRLLTYDIALYYMKWTGIMQDAALFYNNVQIAGVVNGKSASGPGIDVATTLRLASNLSVNGNFSWNGLKTDATVFNGPRTVLNEGDPIQNSARLTIGGGLDYSIPIAANGRALMLSASVNYLSKFYDTVPLVGKAKLYSGDNLLFARAAASFPINDRMNLTVFGENLTNEKGAQHANSRAAAGLSDGVFLNNLRLNRPRPSTVGIELEFRMH